MKASQEFVKGKNDISWVGERFNEVFGDTDLKLPARELRIKKLERPMTDKDILSEFQPDACTLEDMLFFLKTANRSGWYIFYVLDDGGTLWAVHAYWLGGGSHVDAYSVTCPFAWRGDDRVVSPRFGPEEKTLSPSDPSDLEKRVEKLEKIIEGMRNVLEVLKSGKQEKT